MERKSTYTLCEIAEWPEREYVSLPAVQRGFVWRPSQIENLWDSLIRAYPVGAFVMSPKTEGCFEMLDGQQRATAICLGFGNETFSDSHDKIKVFIDLGSPPIDDNRKFIIRVITKSHPWGYMRNDNTKTLSSENIRKAMILYEVEDHLNQELNMFYPYDAILPIPLSYFIQAGIKKLPIENLLTQINNWEKWKKIKNDWFKEIERIKQSNLEKKGRQKEIPQLISDNKIEARIATIYGEILKMLDPDTGQKIPALYLDFEEFKSSLNDNNPTLDSSILEEVNETNTENILEINDNKIDEIENLFVRLNAGGTPIRGEDLNYSILKAHISPELPRFIEAACQSYFKPPRFITIAYKLYQHKKKEANRDGLNMRIKPKQFQKAIGSRDVLLDFEKFLKDILFKKSYDGKTLLEYAKYYLEYNPLEIKYGLPHILASKIPDSAPEVMFMYLYRISLKGDRFIENSEIHRRALGLITLFTWLGKGEKQRDHSKLLSNIWPCIQTLQYANFWSSSTVQRARLNDVLTRFPTFNKKRDKKSLIQIEKFTPKSNSDPFRYFEKQFGFEAFIKKMFYNRDLILYGQRAFLSEYFKDIQFQLDDTNMPFDWDHISPHKLIHNRKGIPFVIKQWYNSNGNFRAWPYALNRMDQDESPAKKLNPLNKNWFSNDASRMQLQIKWENHLANSGYKLANSLEETLLSWSRCLPAWLNFEPKDLKKDWKQAYNLIIGRNLDLCKEWYEELLIEDLVPPTNYEIFSQVIDNRKWEKNIKKDGLRRIFDYAELDYWISKPFSVNDSSLQFYFTHNYQYDNLLENNGIEFGILEIGGDGFIRRLSITEAQRENYDTDKSTYVQGYFTLISHEEDSYRKLISEFNNWLKKFPNSDIKKLSEKFLNSISIKFRPLK